MRAEVQTLLEQALRPSSLTLSALPPLALYIHLPWCLKKCPYCDFNSHETRQTDSTAEPFSLYIDALIADLEASLPLIWGRPVISIFLGGGTPSLFSPDLIDRLLSAIRARLSLLPACEITLEANPGTFEYARFAAYRQAGVTRLSIGVQSFNDSHLQALGRVHNRAQAIAAIEEAQRAFDTFNLDLMYALPQQSLADLAADLSQALAFTPPHLSIYHLTIESNTYFANYPPALPDEDTAYAMLDYLTQQLTQAGLSRYEVSAYARAGHQCQHNLNYWQFGDYLGIGAGAHSKVSFAHRIYRQTRYREPTTYMAQAQAGWAVSNTQEVSRRDLPFEFMLNALRLVDGFELAWLSERCGLAPNAVEAALTQAHTQGLISRTLSHIQPTERGLDFLSDLQSLFLPATPAKN